MPYSFLYRFAKSNLWRRRRNDAQILTPCAWIILCRFLQSIIIKNNVAFYNEMKK